MEKPDVDEIDGIAPAVAIRQKNTTRNPRSTVATSTECYDFLRLLYARVGQTFCPDCGTRVRKDTVDQVAERVLAQPEGSRWYVLFPDRRNTRPAKRCAIAFSNCASTASTACFRTAGCSNSPRRNRCWISISTQPVYVLVDRIAIAPDLHQRLVDTIEICYRESGEVIFEAAAGGERLRFNERFECKTCDREFAQPEPILFSFNSPFGACPRCQGFGNTIDFDMNRVIPDPSLSLDEGAVDPWTKPKYRSWLGNFKKHAPKVRMRRPVLRSDRGGARRPWRPSSGASSITWRARSTSCTCASSSAGTAAMRCARSAAARVCARKRCTCGSAARTWPRSCA